MSTVTTERPRRELPGTATTCRACRRPIVFARTLAGPNGPGGKAMPLDLHENPDGNVAVRPGRRGELLARVLRKGEHHDDPIERLAMPHFATCPSRGARASDERTTPPDLSNVSVLADHRARRARR